MVYWSDVHERSVHRANIDGTKHQIFLNYNHSLGVVDGKSTEYNPGLYCTNASGSSNLVLNI